MNADQYYKLCQDNPNVELVRPFWQYEQYHRDYWKSLDVTVLICQRKTHDVTKLCLESLLRFYPDVPVLIVDGDSQDESVLYLLYKSLVCPNVRVWQRPAGINSHGITMHEAIMGHITTKYVLLMDSDVITMRHGYIEDMIHCMNTYHYYAIGTLMLVTRNNHACGIPDDESDVLRYAHPSCSIYDVPIYKTLAPFADHGAPCVYNMLDAEKRGLKVEYFPIDKYVAHLSAASWAVPRTIWVNDYDVPLKPFVTFIATNTDQFIALHLQKDHDFEIVTPGRHIQDSVIFHDGQPAKAIDNLLYDLRFKVHGEYVCMLSPELTRIDDIIVAEIKKAVINQGAPDELYVGGLKIVRRRLFQYRDCI